MYQALYRKWRPKTFSDVVGQEHVTETLQRQVAEGRLSHAYLFTGTRGTGKTTCAKILAKAVNCEHPENGNPCNKCSSCLGIESGGFLDVMELDAASNNGVDHVRALRDEAIYSPAQVKKRVYIIDEVHMLSIAAFNALLKILEEPPEHLMFILATTELHKVPATILSRCQRFAFRRILPREIVGRLNYIAEQEGIDLRPDGAELLAHIADGALRDALSLLDQCAAAGGTIDSAAVLDALGLAGNLQTAQLMDCVLQRDTKAALLLLHRLYGSGKDVGAVLGELSALARDLLISKTAPEGGAALLIDEAHQLAPRVQDNASAAVSVPQLRALRRGAGQALGRKHPLYGALTAAIRAREAAAGTEEFASGRLERPPEALDAAMARLLEAADGALLSGAGTEAAEAFTLAACWRYAAGRLDARYAVLTEGTEKTAKI